MNDTLSNGAADDECLERAIAVLLSEASPADARGRVLARAAAISTHGRIAPRGVSRSRLAWLAAAAALAAVAFLAGQRFGRQPPAIVPGHGTVAARFPDSDTEPVADPAAGPGDAADRYEGFGELSGASMGIDIPFVTFRVAREATVIVANGGEAPIELGAGTHERGNRIHVWDWSKSPVSRILPDATFPIGVYALSPDGRTLLTADGEMLDLETGALSWINLVKAEDRVGPTTYLRTGGLMYAPRGDRLVAFQYEFDHRPPGHYTGRAIEVFSLPAAAHLPRFLVADEDNVQGGFRDERTRFFYRDADVQRAAVSQDGRRIALAPDQTHVACFSTDTGEKVREYEPALSDSVVSLAFSPDDRYLAASQWEPSDLLVWEAESGRLVHRIAGARWRELGVREQTGDLRFSPDGDYLAAGYTGVDGYSVTLVLDVATGELTKAFQELGHPQVTWSADGRTITAVTDTYWDDSRSPSEMIYPRVHVWDWRSGELLQSHGPR